MEVDSVAAAATTMKAAQTAGDVATAVTKKALDIYKSEGELVISLLYKSLGVGQSLNAVA